MFSYLNPTVENINKIERKKVMNNKLKTILITLIVILISTISFGGIYVKNLNSYTNVMKDYMLARNLKGSRVVELKAEKTGETEENVAEQNSTEEQEVENSTVSKEDLKTAKKILEKRLKKLGSEDYIIEQNSDSGDTTIYLNEDDLTDNITGYLISTGDFKIVDADDENNVLMTNQHLKDVRVGYSTTTTGTTVYLSIEFNQEGKQKLEEISNTYIITTDEQGVETEKKINLMLDDTQILSTSFDETISNGILQMSIGSASASAADLQTYIMQANGMAVILNTGKMPIEYTMEKNEYVSLDNMGQNIQIVIMVLIGIVLIACIVLIIKYKAKGLKVSVSFIGAIAIFLLLVRYTNVYIAMESSIAFVILIMVNTYLNWLILKNNQEEKIMPSILNAYTTSAKITIPVLVIAVVLCFIHWIPIASIGMLLFWGLISIVISSFAITFPILSEKK